MKFDVKWSNILHCTYYQPENLWIGIKAISKLHDETKIPKKFIKSWLGEQAAWQIHIPIPKDIDHPYYRVDKTNQLHQADVMYLTHDIVYGTKYKYVLDVIDVASRFKASRPMKTKKASEVEELLIDI